MLDSSDLDALASAYLDAEKSCKRIRAGSVIHPDFTIADAYEVQRRCIEMKVAEGKTIRGRKIGLTSRAMQRAAGMDEPDYGTLMSDMFYESGADIPVSRFIEPRIECELGFVMGRRVAGADCTIFDVLAATDYVVPCAEIVDGHTHRVDPETGAKNCILDNIADNAAAAAVILGGRPVRPDATDLRWASVLCARNGIVEESGVAAAVMNHPANGVAWLVRKLAPFDIGLEPGDFVLAGSFTGLVAARQGDSFHLDYGPLGSIACHFG